MDVRNMSWNMAASSLLAVHKQEDETGTVKNTAFLFPVGSLPADCTSGFLEFEICFLRITVAKLV